MMCGWTNLGNIDEQMQVVLRLAESKGRTILSGDVSNFDATLPPRALAQVGYVVARWIRGHEKVVIKLVDQMIYKTQLITPTKLYRAGPSSLKSGSGGTNLLGSLTNLAIQRYGQELGMYKLENFCVLGDDFILDGEGVGPDATAEVFSHFGMLSHPDKQFYEPHALQYLQRIHTFGDVGGVYSVYRALGHALGLEHMPQKADRMNSYAYVVRALSQVQNCVFNPYFPDLIKLLSSLDKYRLGAIFADPQQLVAKAGTAGAKMVEVDINTPWKSTGGNTSFQNWLVNGVLRDEVIPPRGKALFQRVYGRAPSV